MSDRHSENSSLDVLATIKCANYGINEQTGTWAFRHQVAGKRAIRTADSNRPGGVAAEKWR